MGIAEPCFGVYFSLHYAVSHPDSRLSLWSFWDGGWLQISKVVQIREWNGTGFTGWQVTLVHFPEGESLHCDRTHFSVWIINTKFCVAFRKVVRITSDEICLEIQRGRAVAAGRCPSTPEWTGRHSGSGSLLSTWPVCKEVRQQTSATSTQNTCRVEMSANTTGTVQEPIFIVAFWNVKSQSALPSFNPPI